MDAALSTHLSLLAEPVRVRILGLAEAEELTVGELARILQTPQSTVSRHLKALASAGWIQRRTRGAATLVAFADALPARLETLWRLVRDEAAAQRHAAEDRARLMSVLAQRPSGSRDFFGRIAGEWDAVRDALFGREFRAWTAAAALPPEAVVCDLGCGTGELLARVAPFATRAIGVDQEPSMIAAARKRLGTSPRLELHIAELTALPIDAGRVDLAFCVLVLHHLPAPAQALAEARRVLADGGRIVIIDMVAHDREDYRTTMGHAHLGFSPEALDAIAADAGLTVAHHQRLPADVDASGPSLFVAQLR